MSNKMFPQYMEKMYKSGIQNHAHKEAGNKRIMLQNCSVFADPDEQNWTNIVGNA